MRVPRSDLNIVFDLGGVVLTWDPSAIAATASSDPATQDVMLAQVFGHADWTELDRGTLTHWDCTYEAYLVRREEELERAAPV